MSAGLRQALAAVARRGAWAPVAVFLTHVGATLLGAYDAWPLLDAPMHVAGGAAIAWFFRVVVGAAADLGVVARPSGPFAAAFVFGWTGTAAVVWEMLEWLVDRFLGWHAQVGLDDTMLDMTLGLVGGSLLLLVVEVTRRPTA